jgi:hypothetical protein
MCPHYAGFEKPIMARHHRMPPEEAGYTYAVEPTAIDRLLANEEESITDTGGRQFSATKRHPINTDSLDPQNSERSG